MGVIFHRVSSSRKRLLPKAYRVEGAVFQLKVIRTVSAVEFAPECRAQSGSNSHRSFFEYYINMRLTIFLGSMLYHMSPSPCSCEPLFTLNLQTHDSR